nr:immunoglobulin heavy chain junction region [Mus musculus]NSM08563.1 immunoglobulin heavy chain junction region [Mus musculus]NSM08642.1 immunoglobulin heavy chain junction region [Mus musculus]
CARPLLLEGAMDYW